MSFSSITYVGGFVCLLVLFSLIRELKPQKVLLLLASYGFYSFWNWRFIALLIGLTSFAFLCVKMMGRHSKKLWLGVCVVGCLGILAYFKYSNFFISTVNSVLPLSVSLLNVILPVGISFIVFEVISYAVDVYRGEARYETNWLDFSLLVAFFPHLISGPILKPNHFLPQLQQPIRITWSNISAGAQLFVWGLIKKTLVADRVGPGVDAIFGHPSAFSPASTWCAVIAYAIQIYGDFSGYTDMAIGSAKALGFDIPQNFNLPYLAENITDFWRRWHISLSTWLRNYLYIPLGGNRKGKWRTYVNLMVVMLLGGLWHGASWNFCLWGGFHGCALAVHKFWMDRKWGFAGRIAKALAWVFTFLFVVTAWVPFRSHKWGDTIEILKKMYGGGSPTQVLWTSNALLIAIPCLILADVGSRAWFNGKRFHLQRFSHQLAFCMILVGILPLSPSSSSPFIYFQF